MVVLAALILISSAQVPGSAIAMEGIWRREGGVYCVTGPARIDFFDKNLHGACGQFTATPDGPLLGGWATTSRLSVKVSEASDGTCHGNTARLDRFISTVGGARQLSRAVGDNPGRRGWAKLTRGPLDRYGQPAFMSLALLDGSGNLADTVRLFYLGPLDHIEYGPAYAGTHTQMTWKETPQKNGAQLEGWLTYMGTKYKMAGLRLYSRGGFTLINTVNGATAGGGSIEWAPTNSQLDKYADGKWGPTDRIIVDYLVPGLAAGLNEALTASR